MILEVENVTWLEEALPGATVTEGDLDAAYGALDQEFAPTASLVLQTVRRGEGYFKWRVSFTHADGQEILDVPLQRKVFGDFPLYGNPNHRGTVVSNDAFHVREHLQKKGFARAVYAREAELFQQWCVSEIHLSAFEAGPAVWVKKFQFLPVEPAWLAEEYLYWQEKNPGLGPPEPPLIPADYPAPFLYSVAGIMLWKELP